MRCGRRRRRHLDKGDGERETEGQRGHVVVVALLGCVTSRRLRWEVEVWAAAVVSSSGRGRRREGDGGRRWEIARVHRRRRRPVIGARHQSSPEVCEDKA